MAFNSAERLTDEGLVVCENYLSSELGGGEMDVKCSPDIVESCRW